MKHVIMMNDDDCKEVVSALRHLRYTVNSLESNYLVGELDAQLERIEKVFEMEANDDE